MIDRRLRFRCLLGWLAVGVAGAAAEPPWPALAGEFAGKFQLTDGSGLPEIAWRLRAETGPAGAPRAEAEADAPGLTARFAVTAPRDGAPGTWQLREATIAVADWWGFAVSRANLTGLPADLRAGGTVRLTGEGTWAPGPVWSGGLRVTLAEGTAGSDEQAWSASGMALEADVTLAGTKVALRSAEAKLATVQVAGVTARNVAVALAAGVGGRFDVRRAQLEAFGGRLALAPFALDPAAPAVRTAAEFSEIALGELAAFVPQALAEARGQIAGRVSVNWSLRSGLQPDAGGLEIEPGAPATFRLAESPGLLTGHASPRIAFLPGWAGPLRRWFSAENPAYETLRRIELGQIPLAMENLRVQLYPDGPAGSRTASLDVVARPTTASAVERVTFSVNLSGPLAQVLRLGLDDRTKIRMTPAR